MRGGGNGAGGVRGGGEWAGKGGSGRGRRKEGGEGLKQRDGVRKEEKRDEKIGIRANEKTARPMNRPTMLFTINIVRQRVRNDLHRSEDEDHRKARGRWYREKGWRITRAKAWDGRGEGRVGGVGGGQNIRAVGSEVGQLGEHEGG